MHVKRKIKDFFQKKKRLYAYANFPPLNLFVFEHMKCWQSLKKGIQLNILKNECFLISAMT